MFNFSKKEYSNISQEWSLLLKIKTFLYILFLQWAIKNKNKRKVKRFLEIGPGEGRVCGFETLGIIKTKNVDYINDASNKISFPDNTFDVIYASHILEHTPWYKIEETLREWVRVLKINGEIEIWVPDGLKIAQAFCDAEMAKNEDYKQDGWYKFNNEKDPNKWFSGRMFSYGDGLGTRGHFNFHLSSFSERYLTKIMLNAGLKDVVRLSDKDCRGCSHGWINLGIKGTKK
jgi:SAM-dependent methyltransferase